MVKIRRNISIDSDVWELAKIKISEPLSCYIQKQLEIACRLGDDKAVIEKELYEKEQEVIALRSQLCKLEKEEQIKRESNESLEDCMPPVLRIHGKYGKIGENQLVNIAGAHEVDVKELILFCKVKGLNVVELFDFNKEGKKGNGSGLR